MPRCSACPRLRMTLSIFHGAESAHPAAMNRSGRLYMQGPWSSQHTRTGVRDTPSLPAPHDRIVIVVHVAPEPPVGFEAGYAASAVRGGLTEAIGCDRSGLAGSCGACGACHSLHVRPHLSRPMG